MKEMVQRQKDAVLSLGIEFSIKHPLFALLVRHSEWILNHLVRNDFVVELDHRVMGCASSTQVVVRAHCMFDNACTSSRNFLLTASNAVWNRFADKAPLINLAHDLREKATRQIEVIVFLAVGTHQEKDGMLIVWLLTRMWRWRIKPQAWRMDFAKPNLKILVCKHRSVILAVVRPNT